MIQNSSTLWQQQVPSWMGQFLGNYCCSLDGIFRCQTDRIWTKVKRLLDTVVGDWENQADFLWIEIVKNRTIIEYMVCMYRPIGIRYNFAVKGLILAFFGAGSVVVDCDWSRYFVPRGTSKFCKAMYTISNKYSQCWFLFLNRNVKHMTARMALFPDIETKSFLS